MHDCNESIDSGYNRRTYRPLETNRQSSYDIDNWTREELHSLKEEIHRFSPPSSSNVEQSHVLMVGPVGAGKSSFFNTVSAIFNDHISIYAPSGSAERSITSKYRMYQIRCPDTGDPLNFRLCDTRGLEDYKGIDSEDIRLLLDGHIPDKSIDSRYKKYIRMFWQVVHVLTFILQWILYRFDLRPLRPNFNQQMPLKNTIHCVCMLLDGSTVDVLPEPLLGKIKNIQGVVRDKEIPYFIIITKLDKLCQEVDQDVSRTFTSTTVQDKVNKVSQIFGVPRNHVLLVKNYEKEYTLNINVSILALRALRNILGATTDYIKCIQD